jgi:predicted nuclease of predicted toxin-antitoxin system
VKLLIDEHYANEIAVELRAAGQDAVTVSERQLKGIDDERLLEFALTESRALLTNNARDFVPIVMRWATSGRDHCGLLLTSDSSMPRHKGTVGLFIRTLRAIMEANPAPRALANEVRWLP